MSLASPASKINSLTAEEIRQRKFLKRGLQLSVFVLGQCGTGKSTFINSLCDEDIVPTNRSAPAELMLEEYTARIYEGGTQINLDLIMAPGFGDFIDNNNSTEKIVEFIDAQFEKMLNEECKIQRNSKSKDTRVHAVLYFIRPTGKGLRELDVYCLKALSDKCNLIPIMSKADLLTEDEVELNRKLIMEDIRKHDIYIYDFSPSFDDVVEDDNESIMDLVPFAMISGTERKIIDQVEHKVREVPHGVIEITNPEHSDFMILRTCLLGACLQDLKETTHSIFYEKYRTDMLSRQNMLSMINKPEGTNTIISRLDRSKEVL